VGFPRHHPLRGTGIECCDIAAGAADGGPARPPGRQGRIRGPLLAREGPHRRQAISAFSPTPLSSELTSSSSRKQRSPCCRGMPTLQQELLVHRICHLPRATRQARGVVRLQGCRADSGRAGDTRAEQSSRAEQLSRTAQQNSSANQQSSSAEQTSRAEQQCQPAEQLSRTDQQSRAAVPTSRAEQLSCRAERQSRAAEQLSSAAQ
jgi:hypothetical protein